MGRASLVLSSAVLAIAAISISPINAATITPGAAPVTVGAGSHTLDDATFGSGVSFLQEWFFNISSATSFSANASVSNASGGLIPLQLSVYRDNSTVGTKDGADQLLAGAFVSTASGFTALLTGIFLSAPGNYYVQVDNNNAQTTAAGIVNGNITLSPVPIPGALPLFATGLVGLIALGRKRR